LWGGGYSLSFQSDISPLFIKDLFKEAKAFSVTPSGTIYVLDKGTNEIIKISPEGEILARSGGFGWAETAFDLPSDVYSPNDLRSYVADFGNHRIVYFDGNLNFLSFLQLHEGDDPSKKFGYPKSATVDRFGSLYIVDGENTRVVKMSEPNTIASTFGGVDGGKGRLTQPGRIRIGSDDAVYVRDGEGIMVYDIYGNYVRRVPFPDGAHIHSFTVCEKALFVLDSLSVRVVTSTLDTTMAINGAPGAIDIAVTKDNIYLLTSTGIIIQPLNPFWLEESEE
jgi:DNA-binding beta-propeller fold protein YncE